jgi:hypothetical protein
MLANSLITIEEAHSSAVTEVIHFNNNLVLSSSKDGYIKVWKIEGNMASIDADSTKTLY